MRRLLVVLGVPIDNLTVAEALDRLEMFVERGRRTGKSHQVAMVNADFVVRSLQNPELRLLLQEADMVTADGMPLVWGARLLGVPLAGRVTGADLVPALAERAAARGYSLFLLGAAPGVAVRAAEVLQEQFPGLRIAGALSPPDGSALEMSPQIVEEIRKAGPDILLVASGSPKQENWIGMRGPALGVPVMIGVGGTLDFIAGPSKRAPRWIQRLWRRYVVDFAGFSLFLARQWWMMRGRQPPVAQLPFAALLLLERGQEPPVALVSAQGHLDVSYNDDFKRLCSQALAATPYVIVNLERARFLDSSIIGTLVALARRAAEAGGELRLAAPPPAVRRTLHMLRLDRFFALDDSIDAGLSRLSPHEQPPAPAPEGSWSVHRAPRRVDATTAPELAEKGLAILEENAFLVLDLTETDFLTSAGLTALVRLQRRAREKGGSLRLVVDNADILHVLELVRFDHVFPIYAALGAATSAPLPDPEEEMGG